MPRISFLESRIQIDGDVSQFFAAGGEAEKRPRVSDAGIHYLMWIYLHICRDGGGGGEALALLLPKPSGQGLEGRRSLTTQCRRRIARFGYAAHTVPPAVTTGGTRRRAVTGV